MVTYSEPLVNDKEVCKLIICKCIRLSIPDNSNITDKVIVRYFDLDRLTILKREHRESGDLVHASLQTENEIAFQLFRYAQSELNRWYGYISQFEREQLKNNPVIQGRLFFDGMGDDHLDTCYQGVEIDLSVSNKQLYYVEYIKSEKWRLFRNRIFKHRGFYCELCGNKKNLQLHHITYERLGDEQDADVMILCKECHDKAHN